MHQRISPYFLNVPQNVHDWLRAQSTKGGDTAETAVVFVDEQLKVILPLT
jgi:hypothetical protein